MGYSGVASATLSLGDRRTPSSTQPATKDRYSGISDDVVKQYIPLVRKIAWRFAKKLPPILK